MVYLDPFKVRPAAQLCPNLHNLWMGIFVLFSKILGVEMDPDPGLITLVILEGLRSRD